MLPMQPGQIERRTYDYKRHGTTTLFAALDIATGQQSRLIDQPSGRLDDDAVDQNAAVVALEVGQHGHA